METMGLQEEWLSQILGQSTRKSYVKGISYFLEFLGFDTVNQLKTLMKPELRVLQFFVWLQEKKGLSSNSARARIVPVQSFFTYVDRPLKLRHKLPQIHVKIENWIPTLEDLQKIYRLGDICVKCWMSLSRDVPARMGDMLKITNEHIASGSFMILSHKEGVVGKAYVSPETQLLFTQLGEAHYSLPTTQRGIDKMMSKACLVAGTVKRLNQHLFRKLFISKAIDLGVSEIIWKLLTFKTVPATDGTYYLNGSELRTFWQKIIDGMPLEPRNGTSKLAKKEYEELQNAMRVIARYVREDLKRNRLYKCSIEDLKVLDDFILKSA